MKASGIVVFCVSGVLVALATACFAEATEYANLANLSGTDHLGRALVTERETGPVRPKREVGLFYYLWHGHHGTQGPYDISKMEAADPQVMEKPDSPLWPDPKHAPMLHWGEPLFGYYLSTDEWVLRRHVQMFIDAGIDVLYFDTTNGYHFRRETEKLFALLEEYRRKGFKVPKFCYYMAPKRRGSGTSNVRDVWDNYYSQGRYRELWYEWDGKPLIITHPDRPYPQEILDFFTFRRPTWDQPSRPDTWYWGCGQTQNVACASNGRREQVVVSVATPNNPKGVPKGAFGTGCSEAYFGRVTQSRSFSYRTMSVDHSPGAVERGIQFQEQIDWALDSARDDVPVAFICQWNEWLVPFLTRETNDMYKSPRWIVLMDEYNIENSRDIEPMKGGYRDAYYFQMMNFVRRWKGLPAPAKAKGVCNLSAAGVWDRVSPVYREMTGDSAPRDWPGYDACGRYVNRTCRNEFKTLQVAVGTDGRIYFRAETVKPLVGCGEGDDRWMELLVKVPNRKTDALGYTYRVHGRPDRAAEREVVRSIALADIGLSAERPFELEFKWSDNRQSEDPMDFYVNGDAAPRGRVNWRFVYSGNR